MKAREEAVARTAENMAAGIMAAVRREKIDRNSSDETQDEFEATVLTPFIRHELIAIAALSTVSEKDALREALVKRREDINAVLEPARWQSWVDDSIRALLGRKPESVGNDPQ